MSNEPLQIRVPADPDNPAAGRAEVDRILRRVVHQGRVNWVGEFTLAAGAGATATLVTDPRSAMDIQVSLHPLTPEAAALVGKVWIDTAGITPELDRQTGSFTVRHPALLAGVVATFRSSTKG